MDDYFAGLFGCGATVLVLIVCGGLTLLALDHVGFGMRRSVREAEFACASKNMDYTRMDFSTEVACVSKKLQDSVRVEMKR